MLHIVELTAGEAGPRARCLRLAIVTRRVISLISKAKGKWLELKTGGRWKRSKAKMKSAQCADPVTLCQATGTTITRSESSRAGMPKAARSVTVQCLKMRRVPRVAGVTLEWYSRLGGLVLLMAGNGHRYAPRLVAYSCSWLPFFSL